MRERSIKLDLPCEILVRDLLDEIFSQSNQDELFEAITWLDDAVCDIEFTRKLRDHFVWLVERDEASP